LLQHNILELTTNQVTDRIREVIIPVIIKMAEEVHTKEDIIKIPVQTIITEKDINEIRFQETFIEEKNCGAYIGKEICAAIIKP